MKKTLFCSTLFVCLACALAPREASAQGGVAGSNEVRLTVGDREIRIAPDKLSKVNKPAPGGVKAAPRPSAGNRRGGRRRRHGTHRVAHGRLPGVAARGRGAGEGVQARQVAED